MHNEKHSVTSVDHTSGTLADFNNLFPTESIGTTLQKNIVNVATDGNDTTGDGSISYPYLTITKALTSITDSSVSNRYIIKLAPGQYAENNPLVMKEGVTIQGTDDIRAVDVVAQNPTLNIFEMVTSSNIHHLSITGATTATGISMAVAGSTSCSFLYFTNCQKCVHINHASIGARFETLYSVNSITASEMIYVQAGSQVSMTNIFPLAGTFTNVVRIANATGSTITNQLIADNSNVGTAYLVENGASGTLMNSRISGALGDRMGVAIKVVGDESHLDVISTFTQYADFGVYVDGTAECHAAGLIIGDCDQGIYTHTNGSPHVIMNGGSIHKSLTLDINLNNTNATLEGLFFC